MTPSFRLPRIGPIIFLMAATLWAARGSDKSAPSKSDSSPAPSHELLKQIEDGAAGYAAACVACHQDNGEGIPGVYPPLVDSEWVKGSEERLIAIVLHGLTGPITVKEVTYPGIPMPAFSQGSAFNWTDEQIAAVLTYVRQAWANKAPPVATKKVTEVRTKMGTRAEMTEEELKKIP